MENPVVRNLPEEVLTLIRLVRELEDKYSYYENHSQFIFDLCFSLGRELKLEPNRLQNLSIAAYLHDLGMILLYPDVIQSGTRIDEEEKRDRLQEHCVFPERVLHPKRYGEVLAIIRGHHEWFNGQGYPDGLKGEEIPLESRIIAVADAFNSLISERAYRGMVTQQEALRQMEERSGEQFDPVLLKVLRQIITAGKI